jgi:hypothetical protein
MVVALTLPSATKISITAAIEQARQRVLTLDAE